MAITFLTCTIVTGLARPLSGNSVGDDICVAVRVQTIDEALING